MSSIPDPKGSDGLRAWLAGQRAAVERYLDEERVPNAMVASEPAWLLAPLVAVWPVVGLRSGTPAFWAISGDLPTDFLPAEAIKTARAAVAAFAERWRCLAGYLRAGREHPTIHLEGQEEPGRLARQLEERAMLLRLWASLAELW